MDERMARMEGRKQEDRRRRRKETSGAAQWTRSGESEGREEEEQEVPAAVVAGQKTSGVPTRGRRSPGDGASGRAQTPSIQIKFSACNWKVCLNDRGEDDLF